MKKTDQVLQRFNSLLVYNYVQTDHNDRYTLACFTLAHLGVCNLYSRSHTKADVPITDISNYYLMAPLLSINGMASRAAVDYMY